MATELIRQPFPHFTDSNGEELNNGYIWIGTAGTDPESNQITVYWDSDLSIPAVQPIRTLNGLMVRGASPARIWVGSDYSIKATDQNAVVVYTSLSNNTEVDAGVLVAADLAALKAIGHTTLANGDMRQTGGGTAQDDGRGILWQWVAASTTTADDIKYVAATSNGVAAGRWVADLSTNAVPDTISIPTDFSTLQKAFDFIGGKTGDRSYTVNIETGHDLTGGLLITGGDFSRVSITSTDATVSLDAGFVGVTIPDADYIPGEVVSTYPDPLFYFRTCSAPRINCKIDMGGLFGEGVFYINSTGFVGSGFGVINAGRRGLNARNSKVWCGASDFRGALSTGIRAQLASTVHAGGAIVSGCCVTYEKTNGAVYASRSSLIELRSADVTNSGGVGVMCRRSIITATDVDCTGSADVSFRAESGGTIDAVDSISGGSTGVSQYRAEFGGRIIADGATITTPASSTNCFFIKSGGFISTNVSTTVDATEVAAANVNVSAFLFNVQSGHGLITKDTESAILQSVGDSVWNVNLLPDGRAYLWTKGSQDIDVTVANGAFSAQITLPAIPSDIDSIESFTLNVHGRTATGGGGSPVFVTASHDLAYGSGKFRVQNHGRQLDGAGTTLVINSVSFFIQAYGIWT